MKEVLGKTNRPESRLPTKLVIKKDDVTSEIGIANEFNKFFTNIGQELARKIPTVSITFETFLNEIDITTPVDSITINELKEAFYFPLKTNKSPGYNEISSSVIINCFSELNAPLKYLFEKSIEKRVFPDSLKIARIAPPFNGRDPSNISNCRPISILLCFSKSLERIMYNRLYKYLTTEKLIYLKQFGFQTGLSTEHAIVKLVDQIYEPFEKKSLCTGRFHRFIESL